MKKLFSVALVGAFLVATNIGCSDSKPAAKPADTKPAVDKPVGDKQGSGTGERQNPKG